MIDVFYLYLFRHVYMQRIIVHSGLKTNARIMVSVDKYILKFLIWKYTSVAWCTVFFYMNLRIPVIVLKIHFHRAETNVFVII